MTKVYLLSTFNQKGFIKDKVYEAMLDEGNGIAKQYIVQGEDGKYGYVDNAEVSFLDVWHNFTKVDISPKISNLTEVATCDLVEELKKREGVTDHWVDPYVPYQLNVNLTNVVEDSGAAVILVVID